jgi:hypothetical protein
MIGLPIPPCVVVRTDDGKLAYISLRFGPKGELPPPVIPEHLVEDNPSFAAGIIAFDSWIGNEDRHPGIVAYVRDQSQRPVTVFDHSHALLGFERGGAIDRLRGRINEPFVTGSLPPHVKSSKEFSDWAGRIRMISNGLIRNICAAVVDPDGITVDECKAVVYFLAHRKHRILENILAAKGGMPKVREWELEAS